MKNKLGKHIIPIDDHEDRELEGKFREICAANLQSFLDLLDIFDSDESDCFTDEMIDDYES